MMNHEFTRSLTVKGKEFTVFDITLLEQRGIANIGRLPYAIRILVENLLRNLDGRIVTEADINAIADWKPTYESPVEIPHHPARVLMQDFTGVPAVVDLAAMRDAVETLGGDPSVINPLIPVELIVDHSVQVDYFGTLDSLKKNVEKEYQRNGERYQLLKWAQKSFDNFSVVPPNSGICHQVNLEHLGRVVITMEKDGKWYAFPDSLVGTDSHTTMINGIGVMGWGVGGIEAEAVMLGQPYFMSIPEVIGVKMIGSLRPGVTATDLVLTVTEMLRNLNVVEKFVEFFGPGMKQLNIPDRATIANMSPEYGATMGFFPVDENTVQYLKLTGRQDQADLVEAYTRSCGLFYTGEADAEYTQVVELDLSTVTPSLAGPSRPQDRIALQDMAERFESDATPSVTIDLNGRSATISNGSVVIAAITSCTNTSNPFVLMGAGLLAKNAVERGLRVPVHVKTSLVPGSRVVVDYLEDAGLIPYFQALGFHLAGFGCTTCIGNSGPLHPVIEQAIREHDLTVASVLSGNRNFEARIHQLIKGNYLASPMLVVAFALAGRIDTDLTRDPVGTDPNGHPVYLNDLWPSDEAIQTLVQQHVKTEFFDNQYGTIFDGDEFWKDLPIKESTTFAWEPGSTYIRNPPYFENLQLETPPAEDIRNARALMVLGDTVTTDHISPAGAIPKDYPAGQYLMDQGVRPEDFNSYGSRRGNHEVMMRGTFGNIRIKNLMVAPAEGSRTVKYPEGREMFVYEAAMKYQAENTPLIVLGGAEYGTGSSRDWAAKGTALLGVKAVIAQSFERIHRSNLVGMGVLPLEFIQNQSAESLGLDGSETFHIRGIQDMTPRKIVDVEAVKADGTQVTFQVVARLDTDIEVQYFQNAGILPFVLRKLVAQGK